MILHHMVKQCLILMSYVDTAPYTTLGSYISQAKKFRVKPKGFEELLRMYTRVAYDNLTSVAASVRRVFTGFEWLFANKRISLYETRADALFR